MIPAEDHHQIIITIFSWFCLLISLIIIAISIIIDRTRNKKYYDSISKLPSTKLNAVSFLWGLVSTWIKTRDSSRALFVMFHNMAGKFEKEGIHMFSVYPFARYPIIVITSPKAYRDILIDQDNIFKNLSYELLVGLIGRRNLIASGGNEWKQDRKIVNPAFKYSTLISMNDSICQRANLLIGWINQSNNRIKDVHPLLATCITHVILESAIGKQIDPKDPLLLQYVADQRKYTNSVLIQVAVPIFFTTPALFYYTIGYPVHLARCRIKKFLSNSVTERINTMIDGGKIVSPSLSDTLLEAHIKHSELIPKHVIVDHVTTFVFVGHKATSYTLNAILFLLAAHVDKQTRLYQELEENFDLAMDIDEQMLDTDRLNSCTYLSAVIKEGQRMYPISATIGRRVSKEFKCNGYTIPVGCEILFDFNSLTKHPESFPYKPFEFIPERFIPDCEGYDEHRHTFAFLPFSHGLRKCIGEKLALNMLKVFIVKLLGKFELSTPLKMEDILLVQDIMVYIRTPIDIAFKQRNEVKKQS